MLLIPFIENSFKHGLQGEPGGAFVHISLNVGKRVLDFSISNNMGNGDRVALDQRKGIGIENTRQRLELLYPGKHRLKVQRKEKIFSVSLKLELNQ